MPQASSITPIEIILGAIAFLAIGYLGLFVFLRNHRSWTNRLFGLLALVLIAYAVVNPVSLHPPTPTPESQLFWIRIIMFLAAFMGPLLFLLVHTFPGNRILLNKKQLFVVLAIMFATSAASLSDLVFKSISYPGGKPLPDPGAGMPLFLLDFVGFFFLSLIPLTK